MLLNISLLRWFDILDRVLYPETVSYSNNWILLIPSGRGFNLTCMTSELYLVVAKGFSREKEISEAVDKECISY